MPAEAFEPPPRVTSGVLRMTPLAAPPAVDAALLSQIVTVSFSQRRKLLRHTLGRWLEHRAAASRSTCSAAPKRLPVPEFVALAQQVGGRRRGGLKRRSFGRLPA